MKVTYDPEADAMLIALADADVQETRPLAPGFFADYDAHGRIIALEILKSGPEVRLRRNGDGDARPILVAVRRGKGVWPQPHDPTTPDC